MVDRAAERGEVRVVGRREAVDDAAREVGVGGHSTETGKVLGGRRDPCGVHAIDECGDAPGDGLRVGPVLALELTDRGVLALRPLRDDVRDGSEVEVDARVEQLATPAGGTILERRRRPRALRDGRGDAIEAGAR